jgi:hypothetical protein
LTTQLRPYREIPVVENGGGGGGGGGKEKKEGEKRRRAAEIEKEKRTGKELFRTI